MEHRTQTDIDIDHLHAFAVCESVGERLRDILDKNQFAPSPGLRAAIARLPELDTEEAPSIVPQEGERF